MEKIHFKTFGCTVNFSESEIMQGILVKTGFKIVDKIEEADVIVLNICTVKGENKALKKIRLVREKFPYKKLIIAGCITKTIIKEAKNIAPDAGLVNTHNIREIVSVVEETLNDNPITLMAKIKEIKLNLPRVMKNKIVGIVPISSGCNYKCTYCSVTYVKGRLFCYPVEDIIKQVRSHLKNGVKEIWITSQDNGAYNIKKKNIVDLLKEIIKVEGDFKIRLGMINPNHVIKIVDDLIEIYKNDKMFKFLHIPVQSGNNGILKLMDRKYLIEDFKKIIKNIREKIPEITISTDIICGFPTETKEQFMDSVNLIKEIKPDVLNISRFIARPNTKSAEMEQLQGGEIKDRSRYLTSIFEWIAYEQNKKWKNWSGYVLIDEYGKDNTFIGRNFAYKPVIVKDVENIFGRKVKVKIIDVTKFDLRGMVV